MRNLMLSTAMILPLMAAPVLAQDTATPTPPADGATETMDTPMGAETTPAAVPATETEADAGEMTEEAVAASGKVVQEQAQNEQRIDWITGTTVMSPSGDNIGDINDVIVDIDEGTLKAAIIGVGGFLGIGEKQIAVPWDQLTFDYDAQRITSDLTREEAEAAAEYVFRAQADAPAATDGAAGTAPMGTSTTTTTPGAMPTTTTAPAATTMEPADTTDPAAATGTVVTPDSAAATSGSGEAGTTGAPSPDTTAATPATAPEADMEADMDGGTEMEADTEMEAAPADGATPAPAN